MFRRNHQQIQPSSQDQIQEIYEQSIQSKRRELEQEGEDLFQNPQIDYAKIAKLDAYEDEGVDNQVIEYDHQLRKAAQRALNRRDKKQELQEEESVDCIDIVQEDWDRAQQEYYLSYNTNQQDEEFKYIDAEQEKGSLSQWLNLTLVRRYIGFHFIKFISNFVQNGNPIYLHQLKKMVFENKQSLYISYDHLKTAKLKLATWYCYRPAQLIPELNYALYSFIYRLYPEYVRIIKQCYVRIKDLPINDSIRNLNSHNLGQIIRVTGVVTTRGQIYNSLNKVYYYCLKCKTEKGPYYIHQKQTPKLGICSNCQSSGPFALNKLASVYRNHQQIYIQQLPSQVPPGRVPRGKIAVLQGDIIDMVKPGEEIQAIGILIPKYQSTINSRQGFPIFKTYIEVNYLSSLHHSIQEQFDEEYFTQLPKIPMFQQKFYNSIAPSIYGHYNIKRAITLAMFGGIQKNHQIKHRTRGDINVLLLGDPGIAKSQFLKSIQQVFPKSVYTTGKGASAVGLTACVKMDPQTKEWKLQAGALVLADKGICLIDQFDKMSQSDRTSIHEAMEQQTISISKAGIVTSLKARCSVIAAANPIKGRYNEANNFKDNTDLSQPILSRFDVLCVMKDKCDQNLDSKLSSFVINQHIISHPINEIYQNQLQILNEGEDFQQYLQKSPQFIKKYIRYARNNFNPQLSEKSRELIQRFYMKIREFSNQTSGLTITARHLQSMIRLCEAHARMHLRNLTNEKDAQIAIQVILDSFINTQKYSVAKKLRESFKPY